MKLDRIPFKSKIILSKLLLNMMDKNLATPEETIEKNRLQLKKKQLRQDFVNLQQRYDAIQDNVNDLGLKKEMQSYNLKKAETDLEELRNDVQILKKELYFKRLETLHDLLNNDIELSGIATEELFRQLLERIKDEAVFSLTSKQNILRLMLQLNFFEKNLSKEQEYEYRDEMYNTQIAITELKKVLKINKVELLKDFDFEQLAGLDCNLIISKLYDEEIYSKKAR